MAMPNATLRALDFPRLAVLDLDGTLVDTVPDIAHAVDRALESVGRRACGEDAVRGWIGDGVEALLRRALDANDRDDGPFLADLREAFESIYARHACDRSRVYDGVGEGLDYLSARGAALACVTNKPERFSEAILTHFDLRRRFSIVVGGDTLEQRKPDPAPLHHALRAASTDASRAVLIGDSEIDVHAARAAGMPVICVSYGYNRGRDVRDARPDAVVDSLAVLSTVFGGDDRV